MFASSRLLHLIYNTTGEATASVIKNCLPHKLGQEVLKVRSPEIPDLHFIEPVCDYAGTGGFQEA